jgi:hypothetical protein
VASSPWPAGQRKYPPIRIEFVRPRVQQRTRRFYRISRENVPASPHTGHELLNVQAFRMFPEHRSDKIEFVRVATPPWSACL